MKQTSLETPKSVGGRWSLSPKYSVSDWRASPNDRSRHSTSPDRREVDATSMECALSYQNIDQALSVILGEVKPKTILPMPP